MPNPEQNSNKIGFGDVSNIALGVSSLVEGITAKKPKKFKPKLYSASIRPAQGDREGLNRAKSDIASQVSATNREVTRIAGSDSSKGILARLGVQSNANKAVVDAEANNSKLLREDQNRVASQLDEQGKINTMIQNQAQEFNAQVDQANYAAKKGAAAQGIQSSLNYIAAKEADQDNKYAVQENANQTLDAIEAGKRYDLIQKQVIAGDDIETATRKVDEMIKANPSPVQRGSIYKPRKGFLSGLFNK